MGGVSSYSSSRMRIGGLATGIDTDQVISDLMKAEKLPLDKLYQKRTQMEWKRDAYREVTNLLSGFKSEFLDVLSSTNMRSEKMYKVFEDNVTNSVTGASSSKVSINTTSSSSAGVHEISVSKLATSEKIKSSSNLSIDVRASKSVSWTSAANKSFVIDVDGSEKTINLGSDTDSIEKLQTLIDNAVGENKINVGEYVANTIQIEVVEGSGISKIEISAGADSALDSLGFGTYANFSNRISTSSTLEEISYRMDNVFDFDIDDEIALNINGEDFTFSKDISLNSMMNQINGNTAAGVYMKYDEINDQIFFEAKQSGAGTNIDISETGSTFLASIGYESNNRNGKSATALNDYTASNKTFSVMIDGVKKDITLDWELYSCNRRFANCLETKIETAFASSGLDITVSSTDDILEFNIVAGGSSISFGDPTTGTSALDDLGIESYYTSGEDSEFTLDGNDLVRSSNTFTIEGINYTLKNVHDPGEFDDISLSLDTDTVYENIKTFVEKYNEILGKVNDTLSEEHSSSFKPLTEEEKLAMSDGDIELWEAKAKSGLLRNDSVLESIVSDLRTSLYESVSGVSQTLSSIGITTGNYADRGKLNIDETELKEAIQNDPDGVMLLFSQSSSSHPSGLRHLDSSERQVRYQEEGLAHRIFDVMEDNISIVSDTNGYKGQLLQKAGMIGDSSEFSNTLYDKLYTYNIEIDEMIDRLGDKEERYYSQFTSLERMISRMNSQGEWLSSQLGGM